MGSLFRSAELSRHTYKHTHTHHASGKQRSRRVGDASYGTRQPHGAKSKKMC